MSRRNIFESGAVEVNQLFDDYLEGSVQPGACVTLVLSRCPLGVPARTAIGNSLNALGLGADGCAYATLVPARSEAEGADIPLDAQSLLLLAEGLDPLRIIAADKESSDLLASAYRTPYPPDAAVRVFGRPSAVFQNLEKLIQTDGGKQKAWALFKTLA